MYFFVSNVYLACIYSIHESSVYVYLRRWYWAGIHVLIQRSWVSKFMYSINRCFALVFQNVLKRVPDVSKRSVWCVLSFVLEMYSKLHSSCISQILGIQWCIGIIRWWYIVWTAKCNVDTCLYQMSNTMFDTLTGQYKVIHGQVYPQVYLKVYWNMYWNTSWPSVYPEVYSNMYWNMYWNTCVRTCVSKLYSGMCFDDMYCECIGFVLQQVLNWVSTANVFGFVFHFVLANRIADSVSKNRNSSCIRLCISSCVSAFVFVHVFQHVFFEYVRAAFKYVMNTKWRCEAAQYKCGGSVL